MRFRLQLSKNQASYDRAAKILSSKPVLVETTLTTILPWSHTIRLHGKLVNNIPLQAQGRRTVSKGHVDRR